MNRETARHEAVKCARAYRVPVVVVQSVADDSYYVALEGAIPAIEDDLHDRVVECISPRET